MCAESLFRGWENGSDVGIEAEGEGLRIRKRIISFVEMKELTKPGLLGMPDRPTPMLIVKEK